jgi:DNA-binding transcriptional ArsR family regulator
LGKLGFSPKRLGKRRKDAGLLILKRLVGGPVYPRDLRKELGVSRNTVSYHLVRLARYGLVKKLKDNRYSFVNYVDSEEAVTEVIKKWKSIWFRYPTYSEVAAETGIPLDDVKVLVHKTKDKTGWFIPNEAIIKSATEKLGEVLVCAVRIRDLGLSRLREDFSYDEDSEIVEVAKTFLRRHPGMLPRLMEDGDNVASWPFETLRYLRENYKPKDRNEPTLHIVRP